MNLAAIIIQLVSYCNMTWHNTPIDQCNKFMQKCALEYYNKQSNEFTSDICIKEWLKNK